jgi:ABC-type multidrug transport system fused ATPase/permease subunit
MLLQAPPEPLPTRPLTVGASTTPRRFAVRVMTCVPRYSVPAAALAVTHQIGEALVPVVMGMAIERAVATGDLRELLLWLGVLALVFLTLSFSWRFGSRLAELGMLAAQHRVRATLAERFLRRRARPGRASEQPGVAVSLAVSDAARLAEAVEIAVYPVGQLAAVVFGGAVLLSIAWPLGIAVLVGAPLLLWLTDRAGSTLRARSGDEQQAAATAAGRAADLMAGYRVIRGIGAEAEASRRYARASRAALHDTLRARRAEGVFGGVMGGVAGLFLAAVAVVAALLTVTGSLGLGEFITVVGLAQFLIDPLQSLALSTGTWWASATASARRVLDELREEHVRDDAIPVTSSPVSDIASGELVVVACEGRSAPAVLAGIRSAHPDALIVPHDAHLFSGTVRENVTGPPTASGRTDAEPAETQRIASALHAAACDDLENVLAAGWDTAVGENGTALSGGQRQRVALARALARDADLLVLHDPTTAVDAVTEARIAERLRASRRHARTVVVTRSPAFVAVADRVVHPPEGSRA